ncbi:hypothetical protein [Micromonospora maritima]|uniref:hypothetical protein n=1 Tax=Micromonospora maritima TaxID=986711 RepID=UPI00157CF7DB|nr:hypothetical protein [Micromonospora maritima]
MTTTTAPVRDHLLHGDPATVMGDVALLKARGALVRVSDPVPHPAKAGHIVVKVWVDSGIATPSAGTSTAVAVRRPAAPARVAPLRHPAAKPGWSTRRKVAVAVAVALGLTFVAGLAASWLISIDLTQAAATAVGFVALLALAVAGVRSLAGHKATCPGLITHCSGCKG